MRDLLPPILGKVRTRTPGNLVRRPVLPKPLSDIAAQLGTLDLGRPRTLAAACIGLLLGRHRPVAVSATVASKLSGNRALAPAQPVGNLPQHFSSPVQVGYDLTFLHGKTTCHRRDSFQTGFS